MNDIIPIHLAFEDHLHDAVIKKIISKIEKPYHIGRCFSKNGFGYLKKNIMGFNNAAKGIPFLVLTDLDKIECPPLLVQEWLTVPRHPNLIFRVAVRQVESWVLAHREAFSEWLKIKINTIPQNCDSIVDAKKFLIDCVRKSRRKELRNSIVPPNGSVRKQGPNYNEPLSRFVNEEWNLKEACKHSPSLQKTIEALMEFEPKYN